MFWWIPNNHGKVKLVLNLGIHYRIEWIKVTSKKMQRLKWNLFGYVFRVFLSSSLLTLIWVFHFREKLIYLRNKSSILCNFHHRWKTSFFCPKSILPHDFGGNLLTEQMKIKAQKCNWIKSFSPIVCLARNVKPN